MRKNSRPQNTRNIDKKLLSNELKRRFYLAKISMPRQKGKRLQLDWDSVALWLGISLRSSDAQAQRAFLLFYQQKSMQLSWVSKMYHDELK